MSYTQGMVTQSPGWRLLIKVFDKKLAGVVRKPGNAIRWINRYSADSAVWFNTYSLDNDLSGG